MQTIIHAVLSPPLLASVLAEIQSTKPTASNFDLKAINSLPRFKSVYLESLRWATASPSLRVVRTDTTLGPYSLYKGNMAIVYSRTLQTDKDIWYIPGKPESHPSKFWAERFLEGDDAAERTRVEESTEAESNYNTINAASNPLSREKGVAGGRKSKEQQARMSALRPFGGGMTLCPGRHFAANEIMGGLAALILRLEIEVDLEALEKNGSPLPDLRKQGGLFPDRGLMCRVRRRRGA